MRDWLRPLIFAHRGAAGDAPENTLAAFQLAVAQGAHGIELDAKLSADGEVIVFHDPTLDRTTDGHGRVADMRFAALRELDAGSSFSDSFRGEKIPTLAEVFETIGKRAFINVELSNYYTRFDYQLAEKACALVKRFGLQGNVVFSSFLPPNLARTRSLLPEVPRGLLALAGWKGGWMRSFGFAFGDYQSLHPHQKDVTPQQIARVHRLGRRVHVYPVVEADVMRRLFNWGVDGLFTSYPKLALEILSNGA